MSPSFTTGAPQQRPATDHIHVQSGAGDGPGPLPSAPIMDTTNSIDATISATPKHISNNPLSPRHAHVLLSSRPPPVTAAAAARSAYLHRDTLNLRQSQNIPPPSSVSPPDPDQHQHDSVPRDTQDNAPASSSSHHRHYPLHRQYSDPVSPDQYSSAPSSAHRSRASTFQTSSASASTSATSSLAAAAVSDTPPDPGAGVYVKRSLSFDAPVGPTDSTETIVAARPSQKRARTTWSTLGNENSHPTSGQRRRDPSDAVQDDSLPRQEDTRSWAQGQRELLLPKSVKRSMSDDKRNSVVRRPPVSYKPPTHPNTSGGSTSIPPIRAFRSSGSRRSLTLDMDPRSPGGHDASDDFTDSGHHDRTLRALEGKSDENAQQITPPDSAGPRLDGDDGGDVFLRIAREDTSRRLFDEQRGHGDAQSTVSRVTRSSRRPMSAAVNTFNPTSPPQIARRLSDHQGGFNPGFLNEDPAADRGGRPYMFRGHSRDRASDDARSRTNGHGLRESPFMPRSSGFPDLSPGDKSAAYARRRQSSVDANAPSRMASFKLSGAAPSHSRNYPPSPLVPRNSEPPKQETPQQEAPPGVEGTDSTASTAAPSTMWDELDELKSRIHRLELTGKLPPTSGNAMSRASDERPPTATTNATSMSASPKRGAASMAQATDAASTTSSHKESHPLLHSALSKSKQLLSPEIYSALETAAQDALSLSSMMGSAGQPGPISSAASTVTGGPGVTDRQLRRKADSVCRSITELCLALGEGAAISKIQQLDRAPEQVLAPPVPSGEKSHSPITSPTVTKFSNMPYTRRSSMVGERTPMFHTSSPRGQSGSRLEERRNSVLPSSALPSPRYTSMSTATPTEANPTGRKSSILLNRSRRAQTEEPEDGRRSSILRSRRAGTEEPEEFSERVVPMLPRGRRATIENEEDDSRFRTPSRATTEVHHSRSATREYTSQLPTPSSNDSHTLAGSALPRRRLPSTTVNTRLVQPAVSAGMASRRYLERSTPDRETNPNIDRLHDERAHRQYAIGQATSVNRATSIKRPNRESVIATSSPAGQTYR